MEQPEAYVPILLDRVIAAEQHEAYLVDELLEFLIDSALRLPDLPLCGARLEVWQYTCKGPELKRVHQMPRVFVWSKGDRHAKEEGRLSTVSWSR